MDLTHIYGNKMVQIADIITEKVIHKISKLINIDEDCDLQINLKIDSNFIIKCLRDLDMDNISKDENYDWPSLFAIINYNLKEYGPDHRDVPIEMILIKLLV